MGRSINEGFDANADLSAKQYYMVVNSTGNRVDAAGTAGEEVIGVIQNKPSAAGRRATVTLLGYTRVRAGDTITAGGVFATDANGTAVAVTSGSYGAGVAITGVASGGIFQGHVTHPGYKGY